MGGNVREWEETDEDLVNDLINTNTLDEPYRGIHDGDWYDGGSSYSGYRAPAPAAMGYSGVGFRVASIAVPEPNTLLLGALASVGVLWRRRRQFIATGDSDNLRELRDFMPLDFDARHGQSGVLHALDG